MRSKFSDLTVLFDGENFESIVLSELKKERFKDRGEDLLFRYHRDLPADEDFHLILSELWNEGIAPDSKIQTEVSL